MKKYFRADYFARILCEVDTNEDGKIAEDVLKDLNELSERFNNLFSELVLTSKAPGSKDTDFFKFVSSVADSTLFTDTSEEAYALENAESGGKSIRIRAAGQMNMTRKISAEAAEKSFTPSANGYLVPDFS
jgi:hypothetical protein